VDLATCVKKNNNTIQYKSLKYILSKENSLSILKKINYTLILAIWPRSDREVREEAAKRIVIIDVTVPFENGTGALESARRAKIEKYRPLAEELRRQGYRVVVDAIVVGALGTWDPINERVLKVLNISQHYASLMRRLIVSETIHWSMLIDPV